MRENGYLPIIECYNKLTQYFHRKSQANVTSRKDMK